MNTKKIKPELRNKTQKLKCPHSKDLTLQRGKKIKNDIHEMHYKSPNKQDLAVGFVYYNCVKSKRILMNYFYTLEKFKLANIPTYTIEMYETTPDIKDAIHIKTDFILFQKERLCRILEKHIPKSFTKILFIDTDLVFDNPNWYNELSDSLNTFNVVQPFVKAYWLDITYRYFIRTLFSFVMPTCKKNNIKLGNNIHGKFHPGFAWAFQRKWYNDVGFYEDILGGADTISVFIWLGLTISNDVVIYQSDNIAKYKEKVSKNPPMIGYINGSIYHLYHGNLEKRQYGSKHKIFKSVKNIYDVVKIDKNGLFKLKDDQYKSRIRKYFMNRDDDGI